MVTSVCGEGGRYRDGGEGGMTIGLRQAPGCIVQHGEYSQYFVIM